MVAVLDDKLKVGKFTSGVKVTVPVAETHPLTVFVTATVNTPEPPIVGLLIDVLLIVPVAGAVHVYVVFGFELLVTVTVVLGLPQVVVKEVALKLNVGEVVFVGTKTTALPAGLVQPVMVFVTITE